MTANQFDLAGLVTRLCARYNVQDLVALYQTPEFKKNYAEQHAKQAGASVQSTTGKALREMAYITTENVTLQAHILDPRNVEVRFDKDEKKRVAVGLGVTLALPDGSTRDIHYADFDPTKHVDDQVPPAGWMPGQRIASPVTLSGITVSEDLTDGTSRIRMPKTSTVTPGGHTRPFPEGPDLEGEIGATAEKNGWGAWRIDKRFGTIHGRFGDSDFETVPAVLTITDDPKLIKVEDFEKDFDGNEILPEDFVIKAPCSDRLGNIVQPKFGLNATLDQLGMSSSTPKDTIAARLRGQRVLVRGQGSITAQMEPKDVGSALFDKVMGELRGHDAFTAYGQKKQALRLDLSKVPPIIDSQGNEVRRKTIPFGDKQAYDIVQKVDKDGKERGWEVSFLCRDISKRLPWMSVMEGAPRIGRLPYNKGGFFQFLEGAAIELAEDDPFRQLAGQLPLPMA